MSRIAGRIEEEDVTDTQRLLTDVRDIHLTGLSQVRAVSRVGLPGAGPGSGGDPTVRGAWVAAASAGDWRPGRDSAPGRGQRRVPARGRTAAPCFQIVVG